MNPGNWLERNILQRRLIKKDNGTISYVQIIGFALIFIGILYLLFEIVCPVQYGSAPLDGDKMAVVFFVIMLGISFAFPELLAGNDGLSTMRVVVFMMVNVICLLLLKIGWGKDIKSLTDIGLNQYWVGVIAFVFGAKATQSFFESRMAKATDPVSNSNSSTGGSASATSDGLPKVLNEDVIRMAIKQFSLKQKEGVVGVGRIIRKENNNNVAYLQINVSDAKYVPVYSIPFNVDLGNGSTQTITPVVNVVGTPRTHSGDVGNGICNTTRVNGTGTFGCVVRDNVNNKKHILSCQHVLNGDVNYNTVSIKSEIAFANNPGISFAIHVMGELSHEIDAGIAEITVGEAGYDNNSLGIIKGTRDLTLDDINGTVGVHLLGCDLNSGNSKKCDGVIVNNDFFASISYPGNQQNGFEDLIVLSNTAGSNPKSITKGGYSGSLVIDQNNFAIGLIIGGDDSYSYAVPINKIMTKFNCTII